jgi:small subunit ribosomal protein S19e
MRTAYGGKRDRGSSPYQFRKGGGSSLRKVLQQLEAVGYVAKDKHGRSLSVAGRSFLDGIAHSLRKNAEEKVEGLSKY